MRRINIDKPLWIAAHFGFHPIEAPSINDSDIKITKDCNDEPSIVPKTERKGGRLVCNAPEKAAFIRHYIEKKFANLPHPLALSWRRGKEYSLELVGYPIGIAEAKLIRTALSVLNEEGHKNLFVEINSIGDKDSVASYERELKSFIAKISCNLSNEFKRVFKDDAFTLPKLSHEAIDELKKDMPSSVASLSASSRGQFKEVLDHLDAINVEYRFAPDLVGHKNLCSETLFAIRDQDDNLLSAGYRYGKLSRRFGFKKELSLVGATIYGDRKLKDTKMYKEMPKSKFYLVHLGREARMKSLSLIELLRSVHIPVYHFLGREKLTAQMQAEEALRMPYHLILGQKEALDNTVTIRNVNTRAQDTVPLNRLGDYLKHLPI